MEEETADLREKISGQALIEKNKKIKKESQKLFVISNIFIFSYAFVTNELRSKARW